MPKQTLSVLPQQFVIHSLDENAEIPASVLASPLFFLSRTADELSIVVPADVPVRSLESDPQWRALELLGPLQLSMVGIMAQIGAVLAEARVAIFVVSTFGTDFFLVKDKKLKAATEALRRNGYTVNE